MLTIEVGVERLPDLRQALKGFEDQIPIALAQSITFTAERVQRDLSQTMALVFDKPTPFTLNSVRKTTASVSRPYAQVFLKDEAALGVPASRYLAAQIDGGRRSDKATERNLKYFGFIRNNEFMVTGDDAPLNAYGNLPRGQITKALSNIRGQWDANQNTVSSVAKKRQRKSGRQYFWMPGKGIYWREKGAGLRSFLIVASAPDYQKPFDFFGVADAGVMRHLPEQLQRSIDRVIRKVQAQ